MATLESCQAERDADNGCDEPAWQPLYDHAMDALDSIRTQDKAFLERYRRLEGLAGQLNWQFDKHEFTDKLTHAIEGLQETLAELTAG